MYQTVQLGLLCSLFNWLFSQKRDKGGRRRRWAKYKSSLGTFWKLYHLVYNRATTHKMNGKMNSCFILVGSTDVRARSGWLDG